MNLRKLSILFAAMLVLGACKNHEKSITGAYGNSVIAGQVTMAADVANSSPAGVIVSVGGTGMTAVLAADGRFSFAGVPEGATLHFSRAADGISAATTAATGFNALELSKTAVTTGSRRRATVPETQIEGTLTSVASDSIVVNTESHGSITVALTSTTIIRKGKTTVAPTDLKVGDQVHVQATLANSVYTATQVIVQTPEDDGGKSALTQIEGTLSAVAADSITVTTSNGDVKVALSSSTVITKGGVGVAATDLKVGDRVHVMASSSNSTFTAVQVIVQNDQTPGAGVTQIEGTLTAAAADSITVQTEGHGSYTVALNSSTVIRKGDATVAPGDLKVGDQVHVMATFANNAYTAVLVIVQNDDDSGSNGGSQAVTANGIVSSTGTNSLVVHTASGKDVTVNVNDQTRIRKYGQTIAFSDIKTGDQVEALGTAVDSKTILATQIEVQNTSPHGNH